MSYEDIKNFTQEIRNLESDYKSKKDVSDSLKKVIDIYKKVRSEDNSQFMANALKFKIAKIVMLYEGNEKVKSLEASLQ